MNIQHELDQSISPFRLLDHPFYRAWECGELPIEKLSRYAEEYGAFIQNMPLGWETLNDSETALEEEEHTQLWQSFAQGLGTRIRPAQIPETQALIALAKELFAAPASALGALYAFESQQPETASTKLKGLLEFYQLPQSVEPYFEEHSRNHHESEKILNALEALDARDQRQAVSACKQMSKALWDALSGIHNSPALN